ncbi:MIP/aquaporin family protein [Thermoflexus sp.]|uniref:MIP/aquaporin family protein n=1 Tax=Thermoflexus sp. TaxID=1969742 RepID=UPI002ADD3B11|nr:aquaporin [Thermoflexus sp.]
METKKSWVDWIGNYIGEALGVFFIIFFGCGLLHVAILHGQVSGLFQASIGWGLAVALAIWFGAALSGAHFNPGVTLALAWRRGFPWSQVGPYIISQIVGGFLGAAALGLIYSSTINNFIAANNIVKTEPKGLMLAMMYAPYGPHPIMYGVINAPTVAEAERMAAQAVPWWLGGIAEFICTAILMMGILNFLDERQVFKPGAFFPLALGLLITMLVFVEAPLTMISLNAARDLGPRIWLLLNGYGHWAFPGLQGGGSTLATTVFPALGALFGAWFFDFVMRPRMGRA